jgi:hypothetical protein
LERGKCKKFAGIYNQKYSFPVLDFIIT